MDLLYFVLLVGVLIFVHELGHFWWAKVFGVRVLRVSLGFGPRIFGFVAAGTEYVVAAVPLGGYVKMLGEGPVETVPEEERQRSFQAQPVWKRLVIVFAGPAMNLVFPLVLFFFVYLGDATLAPPIIGTVFPGRPADGHLLPGDVVLAVDGEEVETFHELTRRVLESEGRPMRVSALRRGERVTEVVVPEEVRRTRDLGRTEDVFQTGISPAFPLAVIGVTSPEAPAASAGLRTFDRLVAIDGDPVDRFVDLDDALDRRSITPIAFLRSARLPEPLGGLIEMDVFEPGVATLVPRPGHASPTARTGIEPADLYVATVRQGSPEHRAGVLPGDRIVALDGIPVRNFASLVADLQRGTARTRMLMWRRGTELHEARLEMIRERGVSELGQRYERYPVGIGNWVPRRVEDPVPNPRRIRYAASQAWASTMEMIALTVYSVVSLLEGELTVKAIGGPLTIVDVAGSAAREGPVNYFTLMAFISVNLGLINLLPIPLLDGGHLLFFLVEAVLRRRASPKAREYAAFVGFVVLVLIMGLAVKNDIERKWPEIVDRLDLD